jgi:outer membrane protein TolC
MRNSFFAKSIFLLFLSSKAFAVMTLHDAVSKALKLNPELKSFESQFESAQAKKRQTLAPNEPTLSFQYNDELQFLKYQDAASYQMSITQPFLFPGKSLLAYESAASNAQSIFFQLRAKTLDISNQVKSSYWGLSLARRNLALNFDQKLTFERIAAVARRRYETGAITQVDLLGSEIALYANANEFADLKSSEQLAHSQLNVLIGASLEIEQDVEELKKSAALTRSDLMPLDSMLANRSEIQAARSLADAAHYNYRLSQMSWLPDFQLTLGSTIYFNQAASPILSTNPDTNHTYFAGISMSFPIWGLLNERQSMQSALSDQRAAQYNLEVSYNQSKILLDSSLENLKLLRSKILNYEEHLIPLADQALKIAFSAYSSGKLDFQSLTATASQKRSLMKDYYTQLYNYKLALSAYGQLLGEDL